MRTYMRRFISGQKCINMYFKAVTLFPNNQVLGNMLSPLQISLLNVTGTPKRNI